MIPALQSSIVFNSKYCLLGPLLQLLEFLSSLGQYKMDPVVLELHGQSTGAIRRPLLDPPSWLNDHVIGFAFEYFANSQFHDCSDQVCFISPWVTQFTGALATRQKSTCSLNPGPPIRELHFQPSMIIPTTSWGNPLELCWFICKIEMAFFIMILMVEVTIPCKTGSRETQRLSAEKEINWPL